MANAFLSMTLNPERHRKGFEFNYTKILKIYVGREKNLPTHVTEDLYNFYKAQGKPTIEFKYV